MQGNPRSSYLFVIWMEALSRLIDRAVEGGFLSGYKFAGRGGEGLVISYMLYANDMLVFCEANQNQLAYLNWLLLWFETILGLK